MFSFTDKENKVFATFHPFMLKENCFIIFIDLDRETYL